ncbi:MAG: hypothetical protein K6F09_07535, partial [Clostridiales bacterium]|nr:hypothetical protein [Clostridiales bacterium]
YFTQIFKEIKADEITSKVYSGGIKEGLVGLSAVRIDNDAVNKVVDKAEQDIANGTVKPLEKVTLGDDGFAKQIKK